MPRKTWSGRAAAGCRRTGFNEAAARCRGKLRSSPNTTPGTPGFNEAAARCRVSGDSENCPPGDIEN